MIHIESEGNLGYGLCGVREYKRVLWFSKTIP